jgi:HEAT repeat protein
MRRRTYFVVFGIILLALIGGAMVFHSPEPCYEGRALSEWMEDWASNTVFVVNGEPSSFIDLYGPTGQRHRALRDAATNAICHMGAKAFPHLLNWLEYEQPAWKKRFWIYLSGSKNRLIRQNRGGLVRRLERPAILSYVTYDALLALGPAAEEAVPGLTKLLNSGKPAVALRAASVLSKIGPKGLPPLVDTLADLSRINRAQIAHCIAYMGTNCRPAMPVLIRCLSDSDSAVRNYARSALRQLKPDPSLIVPQLIEVAANPTLRDRDTILYLGDFGRAASNAAPVLIKVLNDPDEKIRRAALVALQQLQPDPDLIIPELIKMVADPKRRDAIAINYIGGFHQSATSAVPVLLEISHGSEPKSRQAACMTLMEIKPDPMVIPGLIEIVDETRDWVAIDYLGSFGPAASNAVPTLQKMLQDPHMEERKRASNALVKINPAALKKFAP